MFMAALATQLVCIEAILAPVAKPISPRGARIARQGGIRAGKTRTYRRAIRNGWTAEKHFYMQYDGWEPISIKRERARRFNAWELTDEAVDILLDELGGDLIDREPKAYSIHDDIETWV